MELEEIIDYIKRGRRNGSRDDAISKELFEQGIPLGIINEAFSLSGRRKQFDMRYRKRVPGDTRASYTVLFPKWLDDGVKKRANKEKITVYNVIKNDVIRNTPDVDIDTRARNEAIVKRKATREEKDLHNIANQAYYGRVWKERRQKIRLFRKARRAERRARREENEIGNSEKKKRLSPFPELSPFTRLPPLLKSSEVIKENEKRRLPKFPYFPEFPPFPKLPILPMPSFPRLHKLPMPSFPKSPPFPRRGEGKK